MRHLLHATLVFLSFGTAIAGAPEDPLTCTDADGDGYVAQAGCGTPRSPEDAASATSPGAVQARESVVASQGPEGVLFGAGSISGSCLHAVLSGPRIGAVHSLAPDPPAPLPDFADAQFDLPRSRPVWMRRTGSGPGGRFWHAMTYDSTRDRVILFGGVRDSGPGGTWEWDGRSWALQTTVGPTERSQTALAFDEAHSVTLLYGGNGGSSETWSWNGSTWTRLFPSSDPGPRLGHAMAYDAQRGRVVLFGGSWNSVYLGDTWEWDGQTWALLSTSGPPPRIGHGMIYDSTTRRILVYGGISNHYAMNDLWAWDGTSWTPLSGSGPYRESAAASYDDSRARMVVFSGSYYFVNDTWEWGDSWATIASSGPQTRIYHAMTYDRVRRTTVVFGGKDHFGYETPYFNDTWEFGLDCNRDGIPDHCNVECGDVGLGCDVAGCGASLDLDGNDVPDECEGDVDRDGDGYTPNDGDCSDNDPTVYPGAPQLCDGKNNDCSDPYSPNVPANEADADGDGFRICQNDCNDSDPGVNPGAAEICDGLDNDCNGTTDEDSDGVDSDADGVRNACDNCRFDYNTDQLDTDVDGVGNSCDNCIFVRNADQGDTDSDGRGNACDNCPVDSNAFQDDYDGDGAGDACDNCIFDYNPSQTDYDADNEGDLCDLNDGLIYVYSTDPNYVEWQAEAGPTTWNVYEGDLDALKATGVYTQPVDSNPLADRHCGLTEAWVDDFDVPQLGNVKFSLVTGMQNGTEWSLGNDSRGNPRPNTNPCP